jgi:hypothetical protein
MEGFVNKSLNFKTEFYVIEKQHVRSWDLRNSTVLYKAI